MGSPLDSTLANAFLIYLEKIRLECCILGYRQFYHRRYLDEIFVLFNSPEHPKRFKIYLNSRHGNISFTIENEKWNEMSFLDVTIIRERTNV